MFFLFQRRTPAEEHFVTLITCASMITGRLLARATVPGPDQAVPTVDTVFAFIYFIVSLEILKRLNKY